MLILSMLRKKDYQMKAGIILATPGREDLILNPLVFQAGYCLCKTDFLHQFTNRVVHVYTAKSI